MKHSSHTSIGSWVAVGVLALGACGGGDDARRVAQSGRPPPAEGPTGPSIGASAVVDWGWTGAFGGTLSGTQERLVVAADEGGSLLTVYGDDVAGSFEARGLLTGGFELGTGRNVEIQLALDPSVPSMQGTWTTAGITQNITGGALPAIDYQIDRPADLTDVVGHWNLTTSRGRRIAIDIDANGVITGTSDGCSIYNSKLAPTKTGYGVFAIGVTFTTDSLGVVCSDFGGGLYGFAVVYVRPLGGQQLVIGAWDGWDARSYLAAAGTR